MKNLLSRKIKNVLTTTALVFSMGVVHAQQSEVKTISLYALPTPVINEGEIDASQIKVKIGFQTAPLEKIKKVYFLLGTEMNSKNVLEIVGTLSLKDGKYVLNTANTFNAVLENSINIETELSMAQFRQTYFVTVIVEDESGQKTSPLTVRLHN